MMMIDARPISHAHEPYLIAELSGNHHGEYERAVQLMEACKNAGADAIKLQTYTADTMTLNSDRPEFQICEGPWDGKRLYDLYESAHTPWEWHRRLFEHARKINITLFSSPFDESAVDLLESLGAPAYKIASFEAIDLPLIRYAASTGKPLIISTGLANEAEIAEAIAAARAGGCRELAILHCVSGYPASAEDYHLRTIPDMIERFGVPVGLSDHTLEQHTAIAGVAMGACIIEKHVTLDRNAGGVDDAFSLEPDEFRFLCESVRGAWKALGEVNYTTKSSEAASAAHRRSIYFVKALKQGERITHDAIKRVRPGLGLAPKYYDQLIGQAVARDILPNHPVLAEDVIGFAL